MEMNKVKNSLVSIYGEDVFKNIINEIKELKDKSNILFDEKYVKLSLSFCAIKAEQIINGEKKKCSLQALVSESFGEAAIYKYNCCDGVF